MNTSKDSYHIELSIEEIENDQTRLAAREELSDLESLYEQIKEIDNAPIEFMMDSFGVPFLAIDYIEIYSVTNDYLLIVNSTPSKIRANLNKEGIYSFIKGIYSPELVPA